MFWSDLDPDWPGCFSRSDSDLVFSRRSEPVDNDLIFRHIDHYYHEVLQIFKNFTDNLISRYLEKKKYAIYQVGSGSSFSRIRFSPFSGSSEADLSLDCIKTKLDHN